MSMRWTIFALGVLLLAGFASAISADCDTSMIAYWELNNNGLDSFGTHDGDSFPDSGPIFVSGTSASFNGNNPISIVDGGQVLDLHGGGGFTIEFWMRASASPTAPLLNKTNYVINWVADSPSVGHIEAIVNGVTIISGSLSSSILTPIDYHVALTWNPAGAVAGNLSLYVANAFEDWAPLDNPGASSGLLTIGDGFVGLIDEVALFSRGFDATEINFDWATSAGGNDYCYAGGGGNISSTRSDFTLAGCQLPDGSSISAGSCSRNGMFYCGNQSLELYYTLGGHESLLGATGCSLEETTYELGTTQCCPSGYLCGDDPEDGLVCNLRLEECGLQLTRDTCDKAGCFWLESGGVGGLPICVDNPSDYSCSIYTSNVSCALDVWNVGAAGMGTEVCGTYFVVNSQGYVIPQDSCACDWIESEDKCKLGYDIVPDIYGSLPDSFRCQKDFTTGDCIDGKQQINWLSAATNVENWAFGGTVGVVDPAVLEAAGCGLDNGGVLRDCGEPIVKLPAFSFLALMSSLAILGLFYFFKKE